MNLNGFRDAEFLEQLDEKEYTEMIKDNMKNAPFEIRDYQDKAVRAALKYHKGILLSCTSSGKSLMIYNAVRCIRKKDYNHILLIVPNIMLVDQMYDDFKDYGYDNIDDEVERLGGGHEATFDKPVLISTWQSLQNKDAEFFEKYSAVFVDEVVVVSLIVVAVAHVGLLREEGADGERTGSFPAEPWVHVRNAVGLVVTAVGLSADTEGFTVTLWHDTAADAVFLEQVCHAEVREAQANFSDNTRLSVTQREFNLVVRLWG